MGSMENWVMEISSSPPLPRTGRWSGTYSVRGSPEMTTPAAWVLTWRTIPSTFWAVSMSRRSEVSVRRPWSSGSRPMASSMVLARKGTRRATRSTSG